MTAEEADMVIGLLGAAYPRQVMSVPTIELYQRFLRPLPYEHVKSSLEAYIVAEKWLPTIAELLEAVGVRDHWVRRDVLDAARAGQALDPDRTAALVRRADDGRLRALDPSDRRALPAPEEHCGAPVVDEPPPYYPHGRPA